MIHWLKTPKNPVLARYIDCYWFLEKSPNAEGNNYPKLNPDPAAHLIVTLPKQIFKYKNDSSHTQVQGSHWLYPYGKTYELDHSKPVVCIGIKFHVGALYSLPKLNTLQGKTMQAFVNNTCAINFDDIFFSEHKLNNNPQVDEHTLLALARNAPDECRAMLDNLCLPWLLYLHEDNHSERLGVYSHCCRIQQSMS